MKWLLLALILITGEAGANAQNATVNRLRHRMHAATSDAARIAVLDSLSMYNMFYYHKPDSTFYYCNEYIGKAFQVHDEKHLALAYARLSFYYTNVGQIKESLNAALKGLDIAQQYHVNEYLSALYYDLAWSYSNLDENAEALKSAFKGIAALKQNKDPFFDQALHLYGMVGYLYTDMGKLGPATRYLKKMDSVRTASKEYGANAIADWYWSEYYLLSGQYHKADSVAADGIRESLKTGLFLANYFYYFSSASYLKQNKIAYALVQARYAFKFSVPTNDVAGQSNAAYLLNKCYEKLNKTDSAYRYLKMKDSLDAMVRAHSNALDVQQFRFDQQLNQKQRAATAEIQGQKNRARALIYVFITSLAFLLVILMIQWRNNKQKRKANEVLKLEKEKVENALTELRLAQAQLVQREKMASLGELTAGIAHEIRNPLNFVHNFSEVSREMMDRLDEELETGDIKAANTIATNVAGNLDKIIHHGKRAESIVKAMLLHARQGNGTKEPVDLNRLASEYLQLAYQGFLAKNKLANIELVKHFETGLPQPMLSAQDMGRVLLNLFNNAFYAVLEQSKLAQPGYKPMVTISTGSANGNVVITVKDNGTGIPDGVQEKIMQPFFTTKPPGEGTGLGLSLSYDIVVKGYGGKIDVVSTHGKGAEFTIELPLH